MKFAVIGHPIGHTMSPFIHSRLFGLSGVDAAYRALDVSSESLADTVRSGGWSGFNITIPHKRAIIPILGSLDPKASMIGSVNTVRNEAGKLAGFSTDGDGFRLALEANGVPLNGRTVILGAGGAARAMAFEAALSGGRVTVAAREHSLPAATELCDDINRKISGAKAKACLISDVREEMDLLVNATPAGMFPNIKSCAAGEDLVRRAGCVFDAVYNPDETRLIRTAKANGIPAVGGMAMLVWQAAAAQTIWTGAEFHAADVRQICEDAVLKMKNKFGNIVLYGFMGSGKTTVGTLLAGLTGRRFVDMDRWIEQRSGRTVSRIFAEWGETGFRALEHEAARELSCETGLIIAAGGGTLLDQTNAETLKSGGTLVFLDASLPSVRARLEGDTTRPLLRRPNPAEAMEQLHRARTPVYRNCAEVTIPADGTAEQTAALVMESLSLD